MKPRLSIAIPTFNRALFVESCLSGLCTQIVDELTDFSLIEIVVSDNASTDDTRDKIDAICQKFPAISLRYFKNEENVGVDKNCHLAIDRAIGDFAWLFCDDDSLEPGAITRVVQSIINDSKDSSFLFVNYSVVVENKKTGSGCSTVQEVQIPGEELFEKTNFAVSFASSCVFNKFYWSKLSHADYFDSKWYHMYCVREMLPGTKATVIGTPLILMNGMSISDSRKEKRTTDPGEIDFYMSAHISFLKFAHTLEAHGYSFNASQSAKATAWSLTTRQIIYFHLGSDSYRIRERVGIVAGMSPYLQNKPAFWILLVPFLLLPSTPIAFMYYKLQPYYRSRKQLRAH